MPCPYGLINRRYPFFFEKEDMAEEKDKPLDRQIKEAELAKLKAETTDLEKRSKQARVMGVPLVQILFGGIVVGFVLLNYIQPLVNLTRDINTKEKEYDRIEFSLKNKILQARADTLKQLSESLKIEQANLAVLNDSLSRETTALAQQTKKAQLDLASVQKRISVLNAQEIELQATIESEKVRVIITAAFGGSLDSETYANVLEKYQMIKAKNYYDKRLNPDGKGIDHQFQLQSGDSVIFDAATGLTWQQSGSGYGSSYADAEDYLKKINAETYGGYKDWRLPTLEEAMSLMEPSANEKGLYIDARFNDTRRIWTADQYAASRAWVVNFNSGICYYDVIDVNDFHVRAVR